MPHCLVTAPRLFFSSSVLRRCRKAGVVGEVVVAVMRQAMIHAAVPMLLASLQFLAIKRQSK